MIPNQPVEVIGASGQTLYFHRRAGGLVLNTNTGLYEAWNASHWSNYAISLPEDAGSGYYRQGTLPQVDAPTIPTDVVYVQAGGSPAQGDRPFVGFNAEGVNLAAINGLMDSARKMGLAVATQVSGKAIAGTLTAAQMTTDCPNVISGSFVGRTLLFTSGNLIGTAVAVTAYDGAGKFTFSRLQPAFVPQVNDAWVLV